MESVSQYHSDIYQDHGSSQSILKSKTNEDISII